MSLTLTSPVTGGAQTGLTSPTYTLATDTAPTSAGKQYAVSALGGTQAGVDASSTPSRPFTWTGSRPAVLRQLPALNASTGLLPNVPNNVYKVLVRKGVTVPEWTVRESCILQPRDFHTSWCRFCGRGQCARYAVTPRRVDQSDQLFVG